MQAKNINAQLRRLRKGLEDARETMAIHFGENDEAVRRADRALRGDAPLELEPIRAAVKRQADRLKGITQ